MRRLLALVLLASAGLVAALWFSTREVGAPAIEGVTEPALSEATQEQPAPLHLAELEPASRTSLATSEEGAAAAADRPLSRATLALRVRERGSGKPVARARVFVAWDAPASNADPLHSTAVAAPERLDAQTDGRGLLEARVPAATNLRVSVGGPTQAVWNPDDEWGAWQGQVEPLGAGARRELTAELPHGRDRVFFGRTIGSGGEAIVGAAISGEGRRALAESGPGGLFRLELSSWSTDRLRASADGYTDVGFQVGDGHAEVADALAIELLRCATLEARFELPPGERRRLTLTLASGGLQFRSFGGSEVTFALDGRVFESPRALAPSLAAGALDDSGRCVLEGIPARHVLRVALMAGSEQVWEAPETISFESGERRTIEWRVTRGARIEGLLTGSSVLERELWLMRAESEVPALSYIDGSEQVYARTQSDAEGRFAFEGVQAGTWLIGPALGERHRGEGSIAAVAASVVVGETDLQFELALVAGAPLSGRVVRTDGTAISGTWVLMRCGTVGGEVTAVTDADGRFDFGLRCPAPHELWLMSALAADASTDRVLALPGNEVVLVAGR